MKNKKEIAYPILDLSDDKEKLASNHTSFLLGAGFSVNMGYPTANQLNNQIQNFNPEKYSINSEGNLFELPETIEKDPFWYSPDSIRKFFFNNLVDLFLETNREFDYEEFYDYLVNPDLLGTETFKKKADIFRKDYGLTTEEHKLEYNDKALVDKTITLTNQIIQMFLVDGEGNKFYKPIHQMKPLPNGYSGFLQLLESIGKKSIAHIHTLNHDLLFEAFNHTDWINGELSNGFEELGSRFYARIEDSKMIRLAYFSNKYDTRYRLYKLHGSIDQYPFRYQDGSPVEYIKSKEGINISNLFKEVHSKERGFYYENDFTNYYADFLSGTSSKILRYNDKGYYKEMFSHLINNLIKSQRLIIVGYGCRDTKINELILSHFDYLNNPVIIIDPYPSEDVKSFAYKLGAEVVKQTPAESLKGIIDP